MSIPDWLEYANAFGTLAAAGLALGAISQSAKNSDENQRALIRERRIDFELDVLAQLAELTEMQSSVVTRDQRMRTLSRMLDVETIPLMRAALDLPSTPEAVTRIENARTTHPREVIYHLRGALADEILDALRAKLTERNLPAQRRRWWPWRRT